MIPICGMKLICIDNESKHKSVWAEQTLARIASIHNDTFLSELNFMHINVIM